MSDVLYPSIGTFQYSCHDGNYKAIVRADQSISDYYRALIPKYYYVAPQMYPAHISVVRKEVPPNKDAWGKRTGERIEFFYSPMIQHGEVYWWLNVFCKRLEEIRTELGLPVTSPYTRPPGTFEKVFHLTIANNKALIKNQRKSPDHRCGDGKP